MLRGSLIDFQNNFVKCCLVTGIFIVAAKRTPFGTYGGKFLKKSITDLQEVANKAVIAAAGLKPEQIDSVVIGTVFPVSRGF
jgi:acetyl-CoA acyltransferase 2